MLERVEEHHRQPKGERQSAQTDPHEALHKLFLMRTILYQGALGTPESRSRRPANRIFSSHSAATFDLSYPVDVGFPPSLAIRGSSQPD